MSEQHLSARALVTNSHGQILLVRQGDVWITPGGHIRPGETIAEAAKREIREETGLDVEPNEFMFVWESRETSTGNVVLSVWVQGTTDANLDPQWKEEYGEVDEAKFFDPEEVTALNVQPSGLEKIVAADTPRFLSDEYDVFPWRRSE